jgi:hypothetical protein
MTVAEGVEVLESISFFFQNIATADLVQLFSRARVEVFVNKRRIADPALVAFEPYGDAHRFEIEYKVKPGDEVTADFLTDLTDPPFTTEFGLTIQAALSFRGTIQVEEIANVERRVSGSTDDSGEAKP